MEEERADENVNTRSGNITRCREKINSKNSFSVKLRQRRRNARVEGKNEGRRRARGGGGESRGEGGEQAVVGSLLSPLPLRSIAIVLHRVGIHFNEFAFLKEE